MQSLVATTSAFILSTMGLQSTAVGIQSDPVPTPPLVQQAYIKASNPDIGDYFGTSTAIDGNILVVGAPFEASNATGVNNNQNDNSFVRAGAAYVYENFGGAWSQTAYLKASNCTHEDRFGRSVAASNDRIAVGAYFEASDSTGVNGDQDNAGAGVSGAVYVFGRNGKTWVQNAYIKASNTNPGDGFGFSIAMDGNRLVVGAPFEGSASTGVNGPQNNNNAVGSGAVYVFDYVGGTWVQRAYLKAPVAGPGDNFGTSVSVSGSLIVVGAGYEASSATGINGDVNDNSSPNAGAAYIFEELSSGWTYQAYLKASNTDAEDFFGHSVAVSGDVVVSGAWAEGSAATGVNGDQSDNSSYQSGAAYVFERTGATWAQTAYLKGEHTGFYDRFGVPVSIHNGSILVGTSLEDGGSRGVNGNQESDSLFHSGAAYHFENFGGEWVQIDYLKASNSDHSDQWGSSVAISDELMVVGSFREASGAAGVNANQNDNSKVTSGAVYVFDRQTLTAPYCQSGIANSTGAPGALTNIQPPLLSINLFDLEASQLPPNVLGYFLSSRGQNYVENPGVYQGALCLGNEQLIGRHHSTLQNSGPAGIIHSILDLTNIPTPTGPTAILAGETWNFQCWHRDGNPNPTSNFTNGLAVLFVN